MNNIEFLSFNATPGEKNLGIATIRFEKRFIFRFKINENPKGPGYFTNAPALKIDDNYYPAFAFDSSYESDQIKKFVIDNVKIALHQAKPGFSSQSQAPLVYNNDNSGQPKQEEFQFSPPPF